jgi:hypothetical protein
VDRVLRGRAAWKLADDEVEYIDVTVTELPYDIGL